MHKLRIIYTGGTIGGKSNYEGHLDGHLTIESFIETLYKKCTSIKKELEERNVCLSFDSPIQRFSENMVPSDWARLAESVDIAVKDGSDSIIIVHGTDTMCYTSAALSFVLQGIDIPVIITGSNIPLEEGEDTDAIVNMHDAFIVALDERFKGVFLVFSGIANKPSDIHFGCRVRKEKFFDNCFKSINVDKVGIVQGRFSSKKLEVKIINSRLFGEVTEKCQNSKYHLINGFDDNISFFKIYPGFDPDLINYSIGKKTKGIILELYNSGTGCTQNKHSLIECLRNAKIRKIPVFATSQHEGNVLMETKYPSSIALSNEEVIPLNDMITEAAIPKLMWILKQINEKNEDKKLKLTKKLMLTNFCGEINFYGNSKTNI